MALARTRIANGAQTWNSHPGCLIFPSVVMGGHPDEAFTFIVPRDGLATR